MRIGILDLDTSHAAAWLPVLRGLGHEIVGVWDGGDVRPPGYADRFAREHGVPAVFASPEMMATAVDCVFLLGCDWDKHVARARPFVRAGRAVFIDKPLVGDVAALRQLVAWREAGARICGGSCLPFAPEVAAWLARPWAARGAPLWGAASCGGHEFGYGIHAYALLCALMGPGVVAARWTGTGEERRVELCWGDGRVGEVAPGAEREAWTPFRARIETAGDVIECEPAIGGLYEAALGRVTPWLAGERGARSPDIVVFGEPELAALAALQSRREGGREVRLCDIAATTRYDGAAYAAAYRARVGAA